jgi:RNA polymerase sigma-70 factor (ECF subfamily)
VSLLTAAGFMEQDQIKTLYENYGFLIFRRCRNILGSDEEAKDAMQEVFLKLINNFDNIKKSGSVVPWIYITAKNHCFNVLRNNKKFQTDVEWERIEDPDNFEQRLNNRQVIHLIFSNRDKKIREAVYYTYVEKLNQSEIHKVTGQSPATVRRNLKKFRDALVKMKKGTAF